MWEWPRDLPTRGLQDPLAPAHQPRGHVTQQIPSLAVGGPRHVPRQRDDGGDGETSGRTDTGSRPGGSFYYQKYLALHKNIYTGSGPGGAAEETLRQGQGAEAGAEEQQQEKR